jgi:hypothetical protein
VKSSGTGRMMPPRRGWGIFGLGFYKDVAPTALANVAIEVKVSITIFQCGQEVMKV